MFGVTLMAVLGVASISPAFPSIMAVFDLSATQVGLLITVFTLPGALLTPLLGVAADRFGRKRVLIPSLLLFGVAGGMCGFAREYETLLLLRFFQGVGATALGSLNTVIIGDLYQGNHRARAMGLNASVLSVGTALYPLIGGCLAMIAWYYPFFLPWLAVPLALAVLRLLDVPEPSVKDGLGTYLREAWNGISDRTILGLFGAGVLTFIILYGAGLTYFSILLGEEFGASAVVIGVLMSGMSISTAIVSSQLGRLSSRFSARTLIVAGFAGYTVSMLLIPMVSILWLFMLPTLLLGASLGITVPGIHTLLAERATLELRGIIMSVNSAMLRVGQTLGPPVIGAVFLVGGFGGAFMAAAALGLVGVALGFFLLGDAGARRLPGTGDSAWPQEPDSL